MHNIFLGERVYDYTDCSNRPGNYACAQFHLTSAIQNRNCREKAKETGTLHKISPKLKSKRPATLGFFWKG